MSMITSYYFTLLLFFTSHSLLVVPSIKQKIIAYISATRFRLFYNVISVMLLLVVMFFYLRIDHLVLFSFQGQTIIAWIFILLGSYLSYISFKPYNTLEFLGLADEMKNERLSVGGMNKYVRHPLYSTGLIVIWGVFLQLSNWEYLGFAFLSSLYIYWGSKLEEQKLITKFGSAYLEYKKRVPMLIPQLRKKVK